MGEAKLLFYEKVIINRSLLRVIVVWEVLKSHHYPEGIKYRLVLVDPISKEVKILFDNHFPKGHHIHIKNLKEMRYEYVNLTKLLNDFMSYEKSECEK